MDPNSTAVAPVDLQIPDIGDRVRHGGVDYTVTAVLVRAQHRVDMLDVERGVLKLQVMATFGPPRTEPEPDPFNDAFTDRF